MIMLIRSNLIRSRSVISKMAPLTMIFVTETISIFIMNKNALQPANRMDNSSYINSKKLKRYSRFISNNNSRISITSTK